MYEVIPPIYISLEATGEKLFVLSWVQRVCFAKNKAKDINTQTFSNSIRNTWKQRAGAGLPGWLMPVEEAIACWWTRTHTAGPTAAQELTKVSAPRGWVQLLAWALAGFARGILENGRPGSAEMK